jgi:hypothetical protein
VAQQVHDPLQPGQPLQIQLALLDTGLVLQLGKQLGGPFGFCQRGSGITLSTGGSGLLSR